MARKRRKKKTRKKKKKVRRKVKRVDWQEIKWGTLTRWLKKHLNSIKRKFGNPFTKSGKLSKTVLKRIYNDEEFLKRTAGRRWKHIKRKIHFYIYVIRHG